jgi:aspartate/tyrosine/aromatic aminotransferase
MHRLEKLTSHLAPAPTPSTTPLTCAFFDKVPVAPPDAIFNTKAAYNKDTDSRKVDLGVGAFRTDEGKPYVLSVVRKAEALIVADKSLDHEYLPIGGDTQYAALCASLIYGADSSALKAGRIAIAQSISGTGGLRLAADFLARFLPGRTVYYPNPTWGNHKNIFSDARLESKPYTYWNAKGRDLDLKGMIADLRKAPDGSIILLHACAHNPTGVDPTQDQWKEISKVVKEKKHYSFFDLAYQGFASGDVARDAYAIRLFAEQGHELCVAQSFAKNFGLYNERTGTLSFVVETKEQAVAVHSQLCALIRPNYSNPPAQGARIVKKVLSNADLTAEWKEELKYMSGRIDKCRHLLYDELVKLGTPGSWKHIITQIGMFSFLGLTVPQCKAMISKHHVYLLESGRISMAGVTTKNAAYVARAIDDVVRNVQ